MIRVRPVLGIRMYNYIHSGSCASGAPNGCLLATIPRGALTPLGWFLDRYRANRLLSQVPNDLIYCLFMDYLAWK